MCICDPLRGITCAKHAEHARAASEGRPVVDAAAARAAGWVPLAEVLEALRKPLACDCSERERNLRVPGKRMHTGGCSWWPNAEYTRAEVAGWLAKHFATERENAG